MNTQLWTWFIPNPRPNGPQSGSVGGPAVSAAAPRSILARAKMWLRAHFARPAEEQLWTCFIQNPRTAPAPAFWLALLAVPAAPVRPRRPRRGGRVLRRAVSVSTLRNNRQNLTRHVSIHSTRS